MPRSAGSRPRSPDRAARPAPSCRRPGGCEPLFRRRGAIRHSRCPRHQRPRAAQTGSPARPASRPDARMDSSPPAPRRLSERTPEEPARPAGNGVRRAGGRACDRPRLCVPGPRGKCSGALDPGRKATVGASAPLRTAHLPPIRRVPYPRTPMARTVFRLGALLALTCALIGAPPASAAGPEATANVLAREMRRAAAASRAVAVDVHRGRTLYALRPDNARMPASVEKLYTTSTALLRLGPEETLTTTALGETAIADDGTLAGNLYLRGGGDPTFGTTEASRLAGALKAAG